MPDLDIDYGFLLTVACVCAGLIVLMRVAEAISRKSAADKTRRILEKAAVHTKEE